MLVDYLDGTETECEGYDVYAGFPLATYSGPARGRVLERVARRVMEDFTGLVSEDTPVGATCVNGRRRGRAQATCDFCLGGRRVEVKSTQLIYDKVHGRWKAHWAGIKRSAYDDLLLVLYTPSGVFVYKHDHTFGVTTTGKSQDATGGVVCVYGPCREPLVERATEVVTKKIASMLVRRLAF